MQIIHAERKGSKVTLSDEEFSFLIRRVLEIQALEVVEQDESLTFTGKGRRHAYSLEELVEGTAETEEELDWGKPAGAEIW